MRGLVSFCLFGEDENDVYYKGAIRQASLYKSWHPNWDLWFYIGKSVPDSVLERICTVNPRVKFDLVDEPENQTSTWWRYRAIKHSDHDFILFRDVDSRLCLREDYAVDEWLRQGALPYHVIRDHPYHGRQLLAGLWGIQKSAFWELQGLPDSIEDDYYQTDQIALLFKVWPICKRKVMAHIGSYNIFEKTAQRRPLRHPRPTNGFVAQGFNGLEMPRYPEHAPPQLALVSDDELLGLKPCHDGTYRTDIFEEKYVPSTAKTTIQRR